jgi:NTE family protein
MNGTRSSTSSAAALSAYTASDDLAVVLPGGGARAAYQVGVLSWVAKRCPDLHLPILTGVSAGAVNVAHLATHPGTFAESLEQLVWFWTELSAEDVFRVDPASLGTSSARWALRLLSGGHTAPRVRGLLDTTPLCELLHDAFGAVDGRLTGIEHNLHRGRLKAVAIGTTSYTTGQAIVWVEGRNIELWERPQRRSVHTPLTVDHVMASAALPIFFPAVRIGNAWHGDGGIRLAAPLSPALHLGASRILAITTRSAGNFEEADQPQIVGYPPPAHIFGLMLNAVFLDLIDQDAARLERVNRLIEKLPERERERMRPVRLMVIRPSEDLGRITRHFEPRLPRTFRFLTRGLGTREAGSSDMLSMLMFQPDYLSHLVRLGEEDAAAVGDELLAFMAGEEAAGSVRTSVPTG